MGKYEIGSLKKEPNTLAKQKITKIGKIIK